jgi:thioredoxin reductase (NADPH)
MMNFDIVIIGAGPAGLQSAIYAARSKTRVVVLGRVKKSSLADAHIENYCCLDETQHGLDFLKTGIEQSRKFGAQIFEEDALKIEKKDGKYLVKTESGSELITKALIMAAGVRKNRLGIKGEKEFLGKGVSFCVECDVNFFKGKKVAVIGNGSAAASGALLLLAYGNQVYLICDELNVDDSLAGQIKASGVEALKGVKVKEIKGKNTVEVLLLENGKSLNVEGVFIELGSKGTIELLGKLGIELDDFGFVKTNKKQETNVVGIYAAGDVCGPPFQVAKSVGEGCVAGLNATQYVRNLK